MRSDDALPLLRDRCRHSRVVHGASPAPRGARATKEFCAHHGIAFDECGKLIVATTASEVARMAALEERAAINGIGCRRIGRDELVELEPNVTGVGALHLPGTGIVDYRLVARMLVDLITAAGGTVRTGERVVAITETAAAVSVSTESTAVTCDRLVVCAGLQADRLAELAGVQIDEHLAGLAAQSDQDTAS